MGYVRTGPTEPEKSSFRRPKVGEQCKKMKISDPECQQVGWQGTANKAEQWAKLVYKDSERCNSYRLKPVIV